MQIGIRCATGDNATLLSIASGLHQQYNKKVYVYSVGYIRMYILTVSIYNKLTY